MNSLPPNIHETLQAGTVIPAHPLALTPKYTLDERRQRALSRYYIAAGSGGIAVGVHTTQFAIHDPKVGLFEPVLSLAREEMDRADINRAAPLVRIAGIVGFTAQAVKEAEVARELGYHAGLLSLVACKGMDEGSLIEHCREVAAELPVVGFYLQPSVGGSFLSYEFWRRFSEIERVVAIKIAPFNRYRTLDVVRAVVDAGREDIALYTGNDDNIVMDLLTPYRISTLHGKVERRIVGGLLGHWSVWTRKVVDLLAECHVSVAAGQGASEFLLRRAVEITDCNAAFFDAANGFHGVIAGIHEVLRRQGLLESIICLDPDEGLSPGQAGEIDRVYDAYPHLNDDAFVAENIDTWLN